MYHLCRRLGNLVHLTQTKLCFQWDDNCTNLRHKIHLTCVIAVQLHCIETMSPTIHTTYTISIKMYKVYSHTHVLIIQNNKIPKSIQLLLKLEIIINFLICVRDTSTHEQRFQTRHFFISWIAFCEIACFYCSLFSSSTSALLFIKKVVITTFGLFSPVWRSVRQTTSVIRCNPSYRVRHKNRPHFKR